MFIFLLNPFDIWNCYYFESNLTLAFHIKVLLIKKHVMMFISPLKMKTQLSLIGLFLCFPRISLGWYCQKREKKGGDFRKRIKRKMFIQRTVCRVGEDLNLELNMSPPAWWTSLRKSYTPSLKRGWERRINFEWVICFIGVVEQCRLIRVLTNSELLYRIMICFCYLFIIFVFDLFFVINDGLTCSKH